MTLQPFSLPVFWRITMKSATFEQGSIVLKVQACPSHFLQKLLAKNIDWGLSCSVCQRPCLVGGKFLCLVFGIPFWPVFDLFMWMQNKGPHYGLFAVCGGEHLPLKADLSHILYGKQTNNHAVFPFTQLTSANCCICWVLILDPAPSVWLSWEVPVHSRRHVSAAKTNSAVGWSLCALYYLNPLCLRPPPAMQGPSHCDSTKGP